LLARRRGVLLESGLDVARVSVRVDALERSQKIGVRVAPVAALGVVPAAGAQEFCGLELPLAVDLDVELMAGGRLELQPGAAVRDDLGAVQRAAGGRVV